jgi:hypothetical protein
VSDEGVTREWPLVLRAAILLEAWQDIEVLQHATWLGPLFVAALLRQEGRRQSSRSPASRRQKHSAGAAAGTQSQR